jgi:hypothetical protein
LKPAAAADETRLIRPGSTLPAIGAAQLLHPSAALGVECIMDIRKSFVSALWAAMCSTGVLAQATITHDKALAGSVTPGDTPGYPVTISQPGHYKLMGNLLVPGGVSGIVITAANVTLDLNGFAIQGPRTCTWAGGALSCNLPAKEYPVVAGVAALDSTQYVALRNGFVSGFASFGVILSRGSIDDVTAESNGYGFALGGADSSVRATGITASRNTTAGVLLHQGLLERSEASRNAGHGVHHSSVEPWRALVSNTRAFENGNTGFLYVAVRDSVAWGNGTDFVPGKSLGGNFKSTAMTAF